MDALLEWRAEDLSKDLLELLREQRLLTREQLFRAAREWANGARVRQAATRLLDQNPAVRVTKEQWPLNSRRIVTVYEVAA